jgi:acyl-CoA reductase-like NAD-dependent aldehyde dehydrogenase
MTTTTSEYSMLIDGAAAPTEATFDVINPATGEVYTQVPDATRAQMDAAMVAAQKAFVEWQHDEKLRREVMHACADALEAHAEEIGRAQTLEQGQPLANSVSQVKNSANNFRRYADLEVPRQLVQDDEEAYIEVVRRPLGVIACIKPWNAPVGQAVGCIAPAFRTGNTVVYKPSPYTPVSALALGEALRDVVPAGTLNVLTGQDPLGQWMTEHPIPRGISFTGSSPTGRKVNVMAAADLKRVVLELGGNDPAIVLDDVDPEELAQKLFWTAFRNTGQICMAAKRVYVPEALHDDIANALARIASETRTGDGLDPETQLGPLTNQMQFDRVKELVADALANGATALTGGHAIDRPGYFFEPTILTGVKEGTRIVDEEQFGPALPIMTYKTIEEAIERANATDYGLGASVWSADEERAAAVAERLESGNAWVNTHSQQSQNAPFSGVKYSGLGAQNGLWSIYAYTNPQTVWRSRKGPTTYGAK